MAPDNATLDRVLLRLRRLDTADGVQATRSLTADDVRAARQSLFFSPHQGTGEGSPVSGH